VSATTDECSAPRRLESLPAVDRQVVATATTASDDPLVECVAEPDPHEHSVWYAVTAPATGRIRADTAGSTYDTVLLALTGTCGELATVACNDDVGTERARIDFPVTAGTDYLLDVMSYRGAASGELHLEVSFRPCGDGVLQDGEACEPTIVGSCATGLCAEDCVCLTPVADECADATVAAPPLDVELSGDTATGNPVDPKLQCVVQPVNPALSAWFRFLAPHDGTVVADTSGSDYDTVLGVFSGTCEALVPIACDDDVALDVPTSQVSVPVSAGVVYTVLVTPYLNHAPGRLHVHVAYEEAP
jgi:hypothetical protein